MKYKVNFDTELLKNTYGGLYIALEGIDECGKTTQTLELANYFRSKGKEVVVTQEPRREGVVGNVINQVLQRNVKIPKVALQYLFSADRAIHQEELVIPALKQGKIVISDRTYWSGIAYGILDRGHFEKTSHSQDQLLVALSLLSQYHQFVSADVLVYLDISIDTAVGRLSHESKKTELYEKKELLTTVKEIYEWVIGEFDGVFTVANGEQSKEGVTKEIVKIIEKSGFAL